MITEAKHREWVEFGKYEYDHRENSVLYCYTEPLEIRGKKQEPCRILENIKTKEGKGNNQQAERIIYGLAGNTNR